MEDYAVGRPADVLRPFVASYTGYRSVDVAPAVHRGLPSPYVTVILTLDDPLVMLSHPDPAQPGGTYDAIVGGLHTTPVLITHDGRQSGIQLSLTPLGLPALLGLPAGELASLDVPAEQVLGPRVDLLRERLLHAPGWAARFAVLDAVLSGWLRDAPPPRTEVARAWDRLLTSSGSVRVEDLALEVGWSARHLGSQFHAAVGLSPKAAARVVRFDRARRGLQARPGRLLAELAASAGYYDQAHLAREFRELAGLPPSAWLLAEFGPDVFRNVQAPQALPEAG